MLQHKNFATLVKQHYMYFKEKSKHYFLTNSFLYAIIKVIKFFLIFMEIIIIWIIAFLLLVFNIFLFLLGKKIERLEKKIRLSFSERTNLLPAIYEVSEKYLIKHEEIFKEILQLRKNEFFLNQNNENFETVIENESRIHHELNFIFNVCNKHMKLLRVGKFIYLRGIIIEKSNKIGLLISFYKEIVKKYNFFLQLNNFFIIGLFIQKEKKGEI